MNSYECQEEDEAIRLSNQIFETHMNEQEFTNRMPPMDVKRYYDANPHLRPSNG